jgi:outer membrane protein
MCLRSFRGFIPASLFFMAFSAAALAQVKIGTVDLQGAVLGSAEIKKASAEMEAKFKPRQAAIEKLSKELQDIEQKLKAGGATLTEQAAADLNAQGTRKQRDAQRLTEDLQADVNAERQEVLGRSTQKMQDIIKKVAEEKSLDMVVDLNNTLFSKPTLDITKDVLAAYDKAYPPK